MKYPLAILIYERNRYGRAANTPTWIELRVGPDKYKEIRLKYNNYTQAVHYTSYKTYNRIMLLAPHYKLVEITDENNRWVQQAQIALFTYNFDKVPSR